jgi:hypothetical protein
MQLRDAQTLLDRCFEGIPEGAPRLYEPAEPRFADRPSAVWLEYRWYVHERGLAEAFVKWKRVEVEAFAQVEASVLRIHLLGGSPTLTERARGMLAAGTPAPERILDVFGDDGIQRECVSAGDTSLTVEQWAPDGPSGLLEEERFQALSTVLASPETSPEERHEAVGRICVERSPRVIALLLGMLESVPSMMALRVLSEWGVLAAQAPLARTLAGIAPDNPSDLWALTALQRRLQAWQAGIG